VAFSFENKFGLADLCCKARGPTLLCAFAWRDRAAVVEFEGTAPVSVDLKVGKIRVAFCSACLGEADYTWGLLDEEVELFALEEVLAGLENPSFVKGLFDRGVPRFVHGLNLGPVRDLIE